MVMTTKYWLVGYDNVMLTFFVQNIDANSDDGSFKQWCKAVPTMDQRLNRGAGWLKLWCCLV